MLIALVPLVVVLLVVGWLFLVAGEQVGPTPDHKAGSLPGNRLASRMTDGLDRTARAVDVLVTRPPSEESLPVQAGDPRQQRATYVVLGGGLLGLAVVLVLGLVLVLSA